MREDDNHLSTMSEMGKTLARRVYDEVTSRNSKVYVDIMCPSPDGGTQYVERFIVFRDEVKGVVLCKVISTENER